MSSSSSQRPRKDRGIEASASGHPGVTSSQEGALEALVFSHIDNLNHPGEVELISNSYGQLLTLYLSFKRNGLSPPSDNIIKHCFALRQYPLPRGSSEDSLHEAMYHLVVRPDEHKRAARGMFGASVVAGSTAYPSLSQGLGAVAQEYLKRALMLYEEFLTGGLSQLIEEDEGPDLRHTLVRHALLVSLCVISPISRIKPDGQPSLGSRSGSLARESPSIGCALAALIGEFLSVLGQAGRGSTLSVYIDPAS
ncbi:hypothetical protein ACOSQ2_008114 [Xanthoceras sorbifolium]